MRHSTVILVVAAVTAALAAGCMPAGEGPVASFAPSGLTGPNIKAELSDTSMPKFNTTKVAPSSGTNE